ncbi:MAG: DUF302 domain-containing protein [Gammaproteobacteria bacterium]|nr:DUF302 domain-containing protein [Gammaproteobacteria bacterium]
MRRYRAIFAALLLAALSISAARAGGLLLARVDLPFPEAMTQLQDSIVSHGYTISRVQRVDAGLRANGYTTAAYEVVFFGKPAEMRALPALDPQLAAYLPLQIVIFSERGHSLILAADPAKIATFFPQPALQPHFAAWSRDIRAIFKAVRHSGQ